MFKLYYAPGACSLAVHIVLREAHLDFNLERVDLKSKRTEDGEDYRKFNPHGYVPALVLADGEVLTEGVAIMQYLADSAPDARLAATADDRERYRLRKWLTFVSSELHKMFSPWLFHPEYGEQAQTVARTKITERFAFINRHLANNDYLLGDRFTIVDAYLFTIARCRPPKVLILRLIPLLRLTWIVLQSVQMCAQPWKWRA